MAAIETNTKSSMHTRSNSFPSKPHPLVSQFEEHLNRLKSSESASSSSSSISHKLSDLQDLYESIDKLLQLSSTQQDLARECSEKSVDKLLEGSLLLLDICGMAKDFLVQSKECIQGLHSVIRRRRSAENDGFAIESGKYSASRKTMKKAIRKALKNLKDSSIDKDNESSLSMLRILKEAEAITVSSLESLLMFICNPKGQNKQSKWSVISKMMQPKRIIACDSEDSLEINEFEKVDLALESLVCHKISSTEIFQTRLENLEMCIQDLEEGVECLSRKLITTRVCLLNIFNH